MEKKVLSPVQAGLLIAIVMILFSLITYLTGLFTQSWVGYVSYLLLCVMIIVAVMNYVKSKDGYATFGNAFFWGFKTSAVVLAFYIVYLIIFIIVFPDFKSKMIDITRESMEKQNRPDDQIETAMNMMNKAFYVFMFLGITFFFLLLGVIGSLLGAAFAKKKPVSPFDQRTT